MPLYEYECPKCGHRFEKIEKVTAPHRRKCPKCGARAERMLAAPAIQFKGAGWYVTDYSSKGKAAPAKEAEGSKDTGKESKEGKETKDGKEAKEGKKPKDKK